MRTWRVISEHGVPWSMKFTSEEGAWGRLLALKGYDMDTLENRRTLERAGWVVRPSEVSVNA